MSFSWIYRDEEEVGLSHQFFKVKTRRGRNFSWVGRDEEKAGLPMDR